VVFSKTILVANPDRQAGQQLAAALFDAGYEAMSAHRPEEVLRAAVGNNPRIVFIHTAMPQIGGYELRNRLEATGLEIPRVVVFAVADGDLPQGPPPDGVSVLAHERSNNEGIVNGVRLMTFADQVGGEIGFGLDRVHGDLTTISFGGLIQALKQHVITGKVTFSAALESSLWIFEGAVIDAWRAPVRGIKAFNRLAGLPGGGFTLTLETPPEGVQTLAEDIGSLVVDAVDERVELAEVLAGLPTLDARPNVQLTGDFFSLEFSRVERETLSNAQEAATFGDLLDRVEATDLEVVRAVQRLLELEILHFSEPRGQVHVLTDSTSDLLAIDARRLGIQVAPVSVQFGTEVFKDGIDLQSEDFHRKLKEFGDLPRTHPVSHGEFLQIFRRLVPSGDVVAVLCSSSLSATYRNALAAIEAGLPEFTELRTESGVAGDPRVFVVDSAQCSGPLGLMAVFARRMALKGIAAANIAAKLEDIGGRFRTVIMVRSIEYVQRAQGIARTAGASKPGTRWLLRLEQGRLAVVAQAAGAEAQGRLQALLMEGLDLKRPVFGSIVQASAPAEAADLKLRLFARLDLRELMEFQLGPAVTSHNGPGSVGAGLIQLTDEEIDLFGAAGSGSA